MANSVSSGQLRYPLERLTDSSDYVKIGIKQNPQVASGNNGTGRGSSAGTILLPLPEGITDSNGANWGESNLNMLEQIGIDAGMDIMNTPLPNGSNGMNGGDFIKELGGKAGNYLNTMGNLLRDPNINEAIKTAIAADVVGIFGSNVTANSLLSRTTGQVLNPHVELYFKGPKMREFQFAFKMTPRSREEAVTVKQIINKFKFHSSPKTNSAAGGGWFIESPEVFDVIFQRGGSQHPYLPALKTCALTNMQVNYTDSSNQNYASYEDGSPVSTILQLGFKELDPVYQEDYTEDGYTPGSNLTSGPGY